MLYKWCISSPWYIISLRIVRLKIIPDVDIEYALKNHSWKKSFQVAKLKHFKKYIFSCLAKKSRLLIKKSRLWHVGVVLAHRGVDSFLRWADSIYGIESNFCRSETEPIWNKIESTWNNIKPTHKENESTYDMGQA